METVTVEQEVRQRVARKLRITQSEVDHIIDTYVDEHIMVQREVRATKDQHTVDQAVTVQPAVDGEAPTAADVAAADELADQAAETESGATKPRKRASRAKTKAQVPDEPTTAQVIHESAG